MGFIVLLSMSGALFTPFEQERITQSGVQHTEEEQMLFETYEQADEWAKQFIESKYVVMRVQGEADEHGFINDWLPYEKS